MRSEQEIKEKLLDLHRSKYNNSPLVSTDSLIRQLEWVLSNKITVIKQYAGGFFKESILNENSNNNRPYRLYSNAAYSRRKLRVKFFSSYI